MTKYTIKSVEPTTYVEPRKGVVNGFLVSFHLDAYNEDLETRVPVMDTLVVKTAVENMVKARDEIAGLGKS